MRILPNIRSHRPSIQRGAGHLSLDADVKGLWSLSIVENDQNRFAVWLFERHIRKRLKIIGTNPRRAGPRKFSRVREDIICRIARDFVAVNGDGAQTAVTA